MNKHSQLKLRIASLLAQNHRGDKPGMFFDVFIEVLVLLNVAAVILESFEHLYGRFQLLFDLFEIFTVTIFSTEFVLRIWTADIKYPSKSRWTSYKKYLFSPNAIIDFLSILPFFIPFILNADLRHLRILRLIRLMRVFKLTKYSNSIVVIGRIVSEKKQELLATLLLMFSVLILASSMMYYIEREVQPEAFPNILYAFWWGIITLTTIGYGDVYPVTGLGKALGGMVAMMGVMIVAIPTAIISSSFVQKMEETKYQKRMKEIRNKLKEAFYKKYIPELNCKVRRGQLSVDAVKVSLELSENDVYKIAEGKNSFRFRYKKVIQNGALADKLFLEFREINTGYGTLSYRKNKLNLVSPESLMKQSIGYFVYCLSEKLRCNYISNEFYGDESTATEESFGDAGLEPDTAFSFRHNKAYFDDKDKTITDDFHAWKQDLTFLNQENCIYLVFNTFDQEAHKGSFIHLTYFKRKTKDGPYEYSFANVEKVKSFKDALERKAFEKYEKVLTVTENESFQPLRNNNIVLYINETIGADAILINICQDYINNEKLFSTASFVADAIREELLGIS